MPRRARSLVAEGFHGGHAGGAFGGVDAGNEPDGGGHEHGGQDGDDAGLGVDLAHRVAGGDETGDDPEGPAAEGDDHRLGQELGADVVALGAEGFADADLVGPFGDADQHDVHHADPA